MDKSTRGSVIAAACIFFGFSLFAYFLPTIMLAVGNYSTIVAGFIAVAFVAAFFLIFWLRGRSKGG